MDFIFVQCTVLTIDKHNCDVYRFHWFSEGDINFCIGEICVVPYMGLSNDRF